MPINPGRWKLGIGASRPACQRNKRPCAAVLAGIAGALDAQAKVIQFQQRLQEVACRHVRRVFTEKSRRR